MNALNLSRWCRLWRQFAGAGDPQPVYQELVARYSEPHRHYHNLQHLAACLSEFDSVRSLAGDAVALELALWFHDAVYDTHAPDNEERSGLMAKRHIEAAAGGPELARVVATLILATKTHDPALHPDAPLLVDIDLSILGQSPEQFLEYERQIRQEYAWVPEATFSAKRAEILARFLDRVRIFSTEPFISKYEQQARINLQNSITALKSR